MASTSWYWTLIQLKSSGGYGTQAITSARLFFQQQFPALPCPGKLETNEDKAVQHQLVNHLEKAPARASLSLQAEQCLRCYISHQILYTCLDLQTKFGLEHGFTLNEVLGLILNDVELSKTVFSAPRENHFLPFSAEVLKTFNPQVGSLSTWASMLTRQQPDLNDFLLEHGIIQQSNWSLLNDKKPEDLERILSETFGLPTLETEKFCGLLKSYHAVYRRDRRGQRGKCKPPSDSQLLEIQQVSALPLSPDDILAKLIEIADHLRQYRLLSKGKLPAISLDDGETHPNLESKIKTEDRTGATLPSADRQPLYDWINDCLDQAIKDAIEQRLSYLYQQSPEKACQYSLALKLYCCDQKTMAEIAIAVGLSAQWQVTRLLKLDDFLASIRRYLVNHLKHHFLNLIQSEELGDDSLTIEQLQNLEGDHLKSIIDKPRANSPTNSFFIQRLCHIVQQL